MGCASVFLTLLRASDLSDGYFTLPPRDCDAVAAQETVLLTSLGDAHPGTTLQEPTGFKTRDRYAVLASQDFQKHLYSIHFGKLSQILIEVPYIQILKFIT